MNKPTLILALLAALTITGCTGLGGGSSDSDSVSSANSLSDGGRGGSTVSDSEIASAVKEALSQDPELAKAGISVSVDHGVVSLSGSVPNVQAYLRAGSAARNVTGVRPPVNVSNLRYSL
ncbi:MAG TPA: BON domain-containing protein [Candidatus Competibacteraceae bacterium]|nr:MAG: BON domain-containing protein [Candidatus Competibacteraceae bacterium]HOB61682.1 BON domain-containing protein [Candidatus Competibacteraceae bacterium]HQA26385.1 BON domain-containing protein [Candidatus Competibacteraceae bacterium]HQD57279.1 BON domain-containing protein [Candidatus Competibacteraceae bacterium]